MAAPMENMLSLGHLTGTERKTLTRQREDRIKKSVTRPLMLQTDLSTPRSHQPLRAMHLQQRWQELKERELTAKQHNRQLLQQFEEAQDTLREMITLTAAMKTIRMEYERYLEESSPRWKQQLKEKTQAAQKKRMEDYLQSCLKSTEERVTKSSADQPLPSQGASTMPQKMSAPPQHYSQNSHSDYSTPHLPYMQPSWQIPPQTQTARFPIRAPYQPQSSFHVPPSFLPPPHPFQPYPLTSTPTHYHPRPWQDPPGWASQQPNYPCSWTVGAAAGGGAAGAVGIPSGSEALWGQLYKEEPPPEMRVVQVVGEEAGTSRAPSSKRERSGSSRSSCLSQELDIKPVRLSGGHAEGTESSRESSQASREKRKKGEKRGGSQCSSSDAERCSSQESSGTSSVAVVAAVTVAQSSESDDSSVKSRTSSSRRTRRSGGLAVGSPSTEKVMKERTKSKGDDSSSPSTSEELGSPVEESKSKKVWGQSPDDKSESCGEESGSQREDDSGSVSIKIEHGDEMEKQESSSSEQGSVGEKDEEEEGHEEDLEDRKDDGEEKENSRTDEKQEERGVEDDDEASEGKNTTEEEDEEHEEDLGDGCDDGDAEEKENSHTDEEQEERGGVEDDDEASEGKSTSEEDEKAGAEESSSSEKDDGEEEQSDRLKNEESENGKKGSASSEDESEGDEDKMEEGESDEGEEGAGEEKEEQRDGAETEDEEDSDDSIILPQNKSKKMHIIQEEACEDDEEDEGSKTGSSDDDSNEGSDEDDVEHLLAPQEQSQRKEEKDLKANEKPKAVCDNVMTFQVKPDKSKSDHHSDSDEFDDFYG